MLQTKTLFFPSVATLAKTDPGEGRWYPEEEPMVRSGIKESMARQLETSSGADAGQRPPDTTDFASVLTEATRKFVFVNCWHSNTGESAAMWAIYGAHHGIALQSRVGLLKSALGVEARPVSILRVDYGSKLGIKDPPIRVARRKQKSFIHEQEIRAVIVESSNDPGISIRVDLEILIEKIYCLPLAPLWMQDVLQTEVRLHGLDREIKRSALDDAI